MIPYEFSFNSMRLKYSTMVGIFIGLAITGAVWFLVIMWKQDKAPESMLSTIPYAEGAAVLFAALATFIYFRKRFKIFVYCKENDIRIEIMDPDLGAPLIVQSPYKCYLQWYHQRTSKNVKMKILYVSFFDQHGLPIVSFKGALGAIWDAPDSFEYIDIMNRESVKRLKIAKPTYSSGKTPEIAEVVVEYTPKSLDH